MGVDGRCDRPAQGVPRPNTDKLARDAALLASADKRVPQLVQMVPGEDALHSRLQSVQVHPLCPLKVDIG